MRKPQLTGVNQTQYRRNKKIILATQDFCGICGRPVDKSLTYPDPMAPSVDHIVPVHRGGHPFALDNLQLAHWKCNRWKSDKLINPKEAASASNRDLPLSRDWRAYKATQH